jgi:hypothetical protein
MKSIPVYMVTMGNTDGSITAGDHIFYGEDGSLNLVESKSWFEQDEFTKEITDFSCIPVDDITVLKHLGRYLILSYSVRSEVRVG